MKLSLAGYMRENLKAEECGRANNSFYSDIVSSDWLIRIVVVGRSRCRTMG